MGDNWRNDHNAIVLPMANSVILRPDRTTTDRLKAQKSHIVLDPFSRYQMKQLQKKLASRQLRSEVSSSRSPVRNKAELQESHSDFIPFVNERSSLGRLLSVEDSRVKEARKNGKRFDLSA